ncbi:MAG: N-acetylmuramoyl-L-alanine amidase [Clostridia bacterium]
MKKEKIVYLSPSTQEKNKGVGDYGTEEFRMNKIADILEEKLVSAGYKVYRNSPKDLLQEIIVKSNELKPDIHVALHSNGSSIGKGRGPEIFTNRPETDAAKLAEYIYEEILKLYYDKSLGRGIKYTNELAEIIYVNAPAVLLEVAFHDNEMDAKWIIANKEQIAKAIFLGIEKYFDSK